LQNVVVYLRAKPPRVHDDYKKTEAASVVLDNHECRFEPHVCLLRTTQTLQIKNSDPMPHNTKFDSARNESFNQLIQPKTDATKELKSAETSPVPVGCNVHPWMRGYLLVRDNPYMAVSGDDGSFQIKNVPAGEWEFQLWHEGPGELKLDGWPRGRKTLTIKPN